MGLRLLLDCTSIAWVLLLMSHRRRVLSSPTSVLVCGKEEVEAKQFPLWA